eukprot:TRINITY_DN32932_c1_g1_i1.p1 TRINITY_DN32932_c1_g1~~TRINITY_DN32932_c1_g1_i1.p1  ORF type:complete len:523 (+),score=97.69 TRINITY_DN32932_c1_g1_i1:83-1570(+)
MGLCGKRSPSLQTQGAGAVVLFALLAVALYVEDVTDRGWRGAAVWLRQRLRVAGLSLPTLPPHRVYTPRNGSSEATSSDSGALPHSAAKPVAGAAARPPESRPPPPSAANSSAVPAAVRSSMPPPAPPGARTVQSTAAPLPGPWVSGVRSFRHCLTLLRNFCVGGGRVLLYEGGRQGVQKGRLHACNEATKRVRIPVERLPAPTAAPAQPEGSRPGLVLTFWGTVGYHLIQRIAPTHKLLNDLNWTEPPVVYLHSKSRSSLKLGSPTDWNDGGSNYNWGLFRAVARHPRDLAPFHDPGPLRCFRRGLVGGWRMFEGEAPFEWRKEDLPRFRKAVLDAAGLALARPPFCGGGRLRATVVQRHTRYGRTTSNAPGVLAACADKGFAPTLAVWEGMPLAQQMRVICDTDVLTGIHGNGLFWVAFLERGSVLIQAGHPDVLRVLGWNYGRMADGGDHVLHIPHHAAVGHASGPNSYDIPVFAKQLEAAAAHVRRHKPCR